MDVIKQILSDEKRYDNPIHVFMSEDFGRYLLTWLGPPEKYMVGKAVQIRLEAGCFGSDQVFMRHADNVLMIHENQSFYEIDEKYKKDLDELFKNVDQDSIDTTYTFKDEFPEAGFIIPSKIKDGESTPMRDIKKAICNRIGEMIAG